MSSNQKPAKLLKNDKVTIHSHRYADIYEGMVFTCSTDEEALDGESYVHLRELCVDRFDNIGRSFMTKFLARVEE